MNLQITDYKLHMMFSDFDVGSGPSVGRGGNLWKKVKFLQMSIERTLITIENVLISQ